MTARRALDLLALSAFGYAGCTADRTELILVVTTDLVIPLEADAIAVSAQGPSGTTQSAIAPLSGEDAIDLPITIGLAWKEGPLDPVVVTATAELEDAEVVTQVAEMAFIKGERRVLAMTLSRRCRTTACDADETCRDGSCAPRAVDPTTLAPFRGNDSLDMTDDADTDAGACACDLDLNGDGYIDGADVDGDGSVDGLDVVNSLNCARGVSTLCTRADVNCDGDIDQNDVAATSCGFRGMPDCCDACACDTDLDNDGTTSAVDLVLAMNCVADSTGEGCGRSDVNCDGVTDDCDTDRVECAILGQTNCCDFGCLAAE